MDEPKPKADATVDESAQKTPVINIVMRFLVLAPDGGDVELRIRVMKDGAFFRSLCLDPPAPREFTIRILAEHTSNPSSIDYEVWDDSTLLAAARLWWEHNHVLTKRRTEIESFETFREHICQEEAVNQEQLKKLVLSQQSEYRKSLERLDSLEHKYMIPVLLSVHETNPFKRALEASETTRRALELSSGIGSMGEMIKASRGMDSIYRSAFEPASELAKEHLRNMDLIAGKNISKEFAAAEATLERISSQSQNLGLTHALSAERFRMPFAAEISSTIASAVAALSGVTMGRYSPAFDRLQTIIGDIRSPWVDLENARHSYAGIAKLAGLSVAVAGHPFDTESSNAIRSVLGDWRTRSIPEEISTDSILRDRFYVENGFDVELVAPPEPAFTESLQATRLLRQDLLSPHVSENAIDLHQGESKEEQSLRNRMQDAHGLLWRLERDLREFIELVMTGRYGQDWPRKRLPGNPIPQTNRTMYDSWIYKCSKAPKQAGGVRLIDYADFTDYEPIIVKGDNWTEVFEAYFHNKQSLIESLRRLYPVRVETMHGRSISKIEFTFTNAEVIRLLVALGKIPKQ